MPYSRPGRGVYVTNTSTSAAIEHGSPSKEGNFVGVAWKQVQPGFDSVIADASSIEDDEAYFLVTKGVVQVDFVAGFAKGDFIYITDATNVLTKTGGAGKTPYGVVTEIQGVRGTPTGKVRIDLDHKIDLDVS